MNRVVNSLKNKFIKAKKLIGLDTTAENDIFEILHESNKKINNTFVTKNKDKNKFKIR